MHHQNHNRARGRSQSGYSAFPITKKGEVIAVVKVDDDVLPVVESASWEINHRGYAICRRREGSVRRVVYLHRLVQPVEEGQQVDHINGDKLDNRRENLRAATPSQNRQNQHRVSGRSRFRGVCFHRASGRWWAYGTVEGRRTSLGYFDQEDHAGAEAAAFRAQHMPFSIDARQGAYGPTASKEG